MFDNIMKNPASVKRLIVLSAVCTLFILVTALFPTAAKNEAHAMYLLTNDSYVSVDHPSVDVFLTDAQAELIAHEDGNDLLITAGLAVTVSYQEETVTTTSEEETVRELLERMRIEPSPLEMVAVEFEEEALYIEISSEFVFYEHINSYTEHEVVYRYAEDKPDWYEAVIQSGSDGVYSEVYEIIYQDGEEVGRHLIDVIDTEPVTAIIEKGTLPNFANNDDAVASITTNADGSGVLTLENGQTVTFNGTRTMKATAYNSEEPGLTNRTASGTTTHVGVVAVDRKVIPLGTKLYIVSDDGYCVYGFAIAEDTGVRGNRVDLYMDSIEECIQFGVRNCTVYILD